MTPTEEDIARDLGDFYSPDDVQMWMDTSHPLLDNDTPRQVIARGEGDRVQAIVQQFVSGAFI